MLETTGNAQIPIGSVQCEGVPNSTGVRARLSAFGDLDPALNDLWLRAEGLPLQALAAKFPHPDEPTFEHSWGTTRGRDGTVIRP